MRISASVDFLWPHLPLPDGIRAAKAAGFDAVECHWPYETPAEEVRAALAETGLPLLALNTSRGDVAAGAFGLSALAGQAAQARAAIDEALAYAEETGAMAVHVMAGNALRDGAEGAAAREAFLEALGYASARAGSRLILIEPLNRYDAPGYFLRTTAQAEAILERLAAPNVKLMFDCYHAQLTEGDVTNKLTALQPMIGHIQIAAAPGRGAPDHGELDYTHVFAHLQAIGYRGGVGAEYRPGGQPAEETFGWLRRLRSAAP
ncbi:MAG: TIM barrel protein [Pseudomonadota bacterium]